MNWNEFDQYFDVYVKNVTDNKNKYYYIGYLVETEIMLNGYVQLGLGACIPEILITDLK